MSSTNNDNRARGRIPSPGRFPPSRPNARKPALDISSDSVFGAILSGGASDAQADGRQDKPAHAHRPHQISLGLKLTNIAAIVLPFAGLVATIIACWGWGFTWTHLFVMVGLYVATGLGITI